MAAASGLSRVPATDRDALAASTFGTGQVLAAAIGLGVRNVVIGLGGSATTDGGTGLLSALGARFLDDAGRDLAPGGGDLGASRGSTLAMSRPCSARCTSDGRIRCHQSAAR